METETEILITSLAVNAQLSSQPIEMHSVFYIHCCSFYCSLFSWSFFCLFFSPFFWGGGRGGVGVVLLCFCKKDINSNLMPLWHMLFVLVVIQFELPKIYARIAAI